jgi:hypothetical protein
MDQWLAFLDREFKVYNNAEAAVLLRKWQTDRRLVDKDFTVMVKMRKAAAARDKVRKAAVKARVEQRKAARVADDAAAARDALRRKLGFPV